MVGIKDYQGTWEEHVRDVCMAYNTSVQLTTGFTPFYLMFCWQACIQLDVMFESSPVTDMSQSFYVTTLKQSLTTAYDHVHQRTNVTFECQKQHYDKKVYGQPYNDGDFVWLYSPAVPPGQSKKLYIPGQNPLKLLNVCQMPHIGLLI